MEQELAIPMGKVWLKGILDVPEGAQGLILFAHGSGSSRLSPRNQMVADVLNKAGLGTLLFDLLTDEEDKIDEETQEYRFNIELISERLVGVTAWLAGQPRFEDLEIGYFGASTGAAAALNAAGILQDQIYATVSRGGRPDLANEELIREVRCPCLFIVGGEDEAVMRMNEEAIMKMRQFQEIELRIIPEATHLFEEPGKLEEVADLASEWFRRFLEGKNE